MGDIGTTRFGSWERTVRRASGMIPEKWVHGEVYHQARSDVTRATMDVGDVVWEVTTEATWEVTGAPRRKRHVE